MTLGPNITDPFSNTQVNWKHDHHIWRPGVAAGDGSGGGNGSQVKQSANVMSVFTNGNEHNGGIGQVLNQGSPTQVAYTVYTPTFNPYDETNYGRDGSGASIGDSVLIPNVNGAFPVPFDGFYSVKINFFANMQSAPTYARPSYPQWAFTLNGSPLYTEIRMSVFTSRNGDPLNWYYSYGMAFPDYEVVLDQFGYYVSVLPIPAVPRLGFSSVAANTDLTVIAQKGSYMIPVITLLGNYGTGGEPWQPDNSIGLDGGANVNVCITGMEADISSYWGIQPARLEAMKAQAEKAREEKSE